MDQRTIRTRQLPSANAFRRDSLLGCFFSHFGDLLTEYLFRLAGVRADVALLKPHVVRRPHNHGEILRIKLSQLDECTVPALNLSCNSKH